MRSMVLLICLTVILVSGCKERSATDQLKSDLNKAGQQIEKDVNNILK